MSDHAQSGRPACFGVCRELLASAAWRMMVESPYCPGMESPCDVPLPGSHGESCGRVTGRTHGEFLTVWCDGARTSVESPLYTLYMPAYTQLSSASAGIFLHACQRRSLKLHARC